MTVASAREAIAILIDLAERGEIDPWDVQVIEVIDRFLSELGVPHEIGPAYHQLSLSQSGQAFLWASTLVLFKANTLERQQASGEPEGEGVEESQSGMAERLSPLPLSLEQQLRRRSSAVPPGRRRVTLPELIEQIAKIAAELESGEAGTPRQKRPRSPSRRAALQAIAQLAHSENLTEVASQLEQFLQQHSSQLAPASGFIPWDELLKGWTQFTLARSQSPSNSPNGPDRVGVFWALLLLSSQSKVSLSQAEFYQDLRVEVLEVPSSTAARGTG